MKKKTITLTAVSLVVASCVMAQTHPFQDESLSFHERAKNLVSLLTLEEKIKQVGHQTLAIPRLNIKGYNYWTGYFVPGIESDVEYLGFTVDIRLCCGYIR